jgi:hypothetical protein
MKVPMFFVNFCSRRLTPQPASAKPHREQTDSNSDDVKLTPTTIQKTNTRAGKSWDNLHCLQHLQSKIRSEVCSIAAQDLCRHVEKCSPARLRFAQKLYKRTCMKHRKLNYRILHSMSSVISLPWQQPISGQRSDSQQTHNGYKLALLPTWTAHHNNTQKLKFRLLFPIGIKVGDSQNTR